MSKRETRLLALACTFIGIVIGFLLSPIKKGISVTCGNDNTITTEKKGREEKRRDHKRVAPEPISEEI